jgi:acyl carrier protein
VNESMVLTIIYSGIRRCNGERPAGDQIPLSPDTSLFGEDSLVDSLELVSILTDVEIGVEDEFGVRISLADDAAIDTNPWSSVASLQAYVLKRLES